MMKTAVVAGLAVVASVFFGCTKSKPAQPPQGEEARETMHRGGIEGTRATPPGHPDEAARRLPAGHPPMAGSARSAGSEAALEGHEGHDHDAPDEKLPPVVIDGTKGDAAAGKLLFAKLCARCHGESGAGGGMMAAGDLSDKAWQARMTDQKIGVTISHGKPNTKMASFADKMDLQKLNDLVAHIRTLKKR
jgi:mono/diheme cytochrome c family protein